MLVNHALILSATRRSLICACLGIVALAAPSLSRASPETPTVAQARQLLDTYYGRQENLREAAVLITRAFEANPNDAHAYLQAARESTMGRFLGFGRYETGSKAD